MPTRRRPRAGRPRLAARQPAPATCSAALSTTCTGAPDDAPTPSPARHAGRAGADPRARPRPRRAERPAAAPGPAGRARRDRARPCTSCSLGARRAVLGNPAAARGLHDLLVAEGRRYADDRRTARSCATRWSRSEAVDHLRRVWETVSLNVLDGPAPPDAASRRVGRAAGRRDHRARPRRLRPGPPPSRGVRMTLTDPRDALAEQSSFVSYLVGLAGLARVVRALAADGDRRADPRRDADDFVHLLLGRREPGSGDRATRRIRAGPQRIRRPRRRRRRHRMRGGCDDRGARQQRLPPRPGACHRPARGIQGVAPLRGPRRGLPALDQLQPHQRDRPAPVDSGWRRASS